MPAKTNRPAVILLTLALFSTWPHWLWLAQRFSDGSDEPWGLLALVTLLAFIGRDHQHWSPPGLLTLSVTASFMIAASLLWGIIPPIFATALAALGVVTLGAGLLPICRPRLPLLTLALLTLPLTASLNFYFGYPLRWLCAQLAATVLTLFKLSVTPQGAALLWNGKSVLIDAPCAGVAMLWLSLYLAATFSYLNSAGRLRCAGNLAGSLVIAILANVLRNVLLFYKEAGLLHLPHWTHEAIGLLVFGFVVLAMFRMCAVNSPEGDTLENF